MCTKCNVRPHEGKFPLLSLLGQEVIIGFTDIEQRVNGVAVDAYTGRPEAIHAKEEDAKSSFHQSYILHFQSIITFQCMVFLRGLDQIMEHLSRNKSLHNFKTVSDLKHLFGSVYHLQYQGKVERINQNIKRRIGKVCAPTGLSWVDALPLPLMSIRSSVNSTTGFTPNELTTVQQFPGPGAGLQITEEVTKPLKYKQLTALVSSFSKQVAIARGEDGGQSPPTPEWVLLKVIKRMVDMALQGGGEDVLRRPAGQERRHLVPLVPVHSSGSTCEDAGADQTSVG